LIEEEHPPLDYATPKDQYEGDAARTSWAGCLGGLLALAALPLLVRGIMTLVEVLRRWDRFVGFDYAHPGLISLTIGLLGVILGGRWLWRAFRVDRER
jgi:hypothetical protein